MWTKQRPKTSKYAKYFDQIVTKNDISWFLFQISNADYLYFIQNFDLIMPYTQNSLLKDQFHTEIDRVEDKMCAISLVNFVTPLPLDLI